MRTKCVPPVAVVLGATLASGYGCQQVQTLGPTPIASETVAAGPSPGPPTFGATRVPTSPPPPISGGTLLVEADGHTAIASDPDRDAVYVVDLAATPVTPPRVKTVALSSGDEPGRVVEDAAGLVHVALRGGQAIADVDPAAGVLLGKRQVCPAPRGIAYDAQADQLVVACAGGELVRLEARAHGALVATRQVAPDLRDVFFVGGQLFASVFRSAKLLRLGPDGSVQAVTTANGGFATDGTLDAATVAWRTVPAGSGVAMVHEQARISAVPPTLGNVGYYGQDMCESGVAQSTVTFFDASGQPTPPRSMGSVVVVDGQPTWPSPVLSAGALPVDIAVSPYGQLAVVLAGNAHSPGLPTVMVMGVSPYQSNTDPCEYGAPGATDPGEPVAVAFDGAGRVVVQSREPAELYVHGSSDPPVVLSTVSREDTGHAIFHSNSGLGLACASCHPEGGEDGHVWVFAEGVRRTLPLRGTIEGTAPYHWGGELADIGALVQEVYVTRMGGPLLADDQLAALQRYVDELERPRVSPPADMASAARGAALFQSSGVGCATCHLGPKLTNNATVDVGTGGAFQVPSLVGVAWGAPYMHTGCAPTLAARFDLTVGDPLTGKPCAGTAHGNTSGLAPEQIQDLVTYLQTL